MLNAKLAPRLVPTRLPVSSDPATWVKRIVIGQWGRTYAEALQSLCQRAFLHAEVAIGCSGAEILTALRSRRADVLLLSVSLPDMHGVDLLKRITSERLATRVLVASKFRDERTLLALRDAQFDGLIDTQEEHLGSLLMALWLVASGEPYVSPVFRGTVIDRGQIGSVWHKLTPAELRVFAAIGDGSGNEEAAVHLGLSEATVQTHRRNLMHKLGIASSAKLVREAIRLGIVQIMADGRVIRPGFDGLRHSFPALRQEGNGQRTIELQRGEPT